MDWWSRDIGLEEFGGLIGGIGGCLLVEVIVRKGKYSRRIKVSGIDQTTTLLWC